LEGAAVSSAYLKDIFTGIAKVWYQSGEIVETFLYVGGSMFVTSKGFQQLAFRRNTSHLPSDFYYIMHKNI
jgi:antitoxin component YwqK of YwqJK toxin-antitoxin module